MIILDTHTLIWWVSNPGLLPKKAQDLIEEEIKNNKVLISSISVWEIYMLIKKGRLEFSMDIDSWMESVESLPYFKFVPVDNRIAALSVNLPKPLHEDPADRIIAATALKHGATLITSDEKLQDYSEIQTAW